MLAEEPPSMFTSSWSPVSLSHTLCLAICGFTFLRKYVEFIYWFFFQVFKTSPLGCGN